MSSKKSARSPVLLCLASQDKGHRFLNEAKELGCRVFLLASQRLESVGWPRESLEDLLYMPDEQGEWNFQNLLFAVAHLCRTIHIDRIIPLDDFDLEKASFLREHFRIPGLGESATRLFRDKLAMRLAARKAGISVPEFTGTANYYDITGFVDSIRPPWVLKPRLLAGAIGINKIEDREEAWRRIHALGDQQSFFLLEKFVPGDIFHVDSIWFEGKMVACIPSIYGTPPLDVSQGGGIFTTRLLPRTCAISVALCRLNERVLRAFGFQDGVSHTEFIRSQENGELLFLETSARVGGAHIPELIEAGTGINMWSEWAKIESSRILGASYSVPDSRGEYAGLLVSLARQEWPDTSEFSDPELVWRLSKRHHVGFVVRSPDESRVRQLLDLYTERVRKDFHATAPPREKVGS